MPYCTLEDIKGRRIPEDTLIQLTDDVNVEIIDQAVVDSCISDADEIIDGFLRSKYELPLSQVPGIVKTLSADIAAYNLFGCRPGFDLPKLISDKYDNSLKMLEKIQQGKIILGIAGAASAEPANPVDEMQATAPERIFSSDTLGYY